MCIMIIHIYTYKPLLRHIYIYIYIYIHVLRKSYTLHKAAAIVCNETASPRSQEFPIQHGTAKGSFVLPMKVVACHGCMCRTPF